MDRKTFIQNLVNFHSNENLDWEQVQRSNWGTNEDLIKSVQDTIEELQGFIDEFKGGLQN